MLVIFQNILTYFGQPYTLSKLYLNTNISIKKLNYIIRNLLLIMVLGWYIHEVKSTVIQISKTFFEWYTDAFTMVPLVTSGTFHPPIFIFIWPVSASLKEVKFSTTRKYNCINILNKSILIKTGYIQRFLSVTPFLIPFVLGSLNPRNHIIL